MKNTLLKILGVTLCVGGVLALLPVFRVVGGVIMVISAIALFGYLALSKG